MRRLILGLVLLVAALWLLPRLNRDREPLFIDVPPSEAAPEAGPGAWPHDAAAAEGVDPIPRQVCMIVFWSQPPGAKRPSKEVQT